MFVRLFYTLRRYGIPVSTRELIDLNQAVSEGFGVCRSRRVLSIGQNNFGQR